MAGDIEPAPTPAPLGRDGAMVLGEALVDLVAAADGSITAVVGGAPFNVARSAARLGASAGFAGAVSTDAFGEQIMSALQADLVDTSAVVRTDAPTTLALAQLGPGGEATYRFYTEATSVPDYIPPSTTGTLLVTGGLALVLDPLADRVVEAVTAAEFVVCDINCRPAAVGDWRAYLNRVMRVVSASSIIKVSDDDLAVLWPDRPIQAGLDDLLERGASVVIVTRGAEPVIARSIGSELIEVPVPAVDVVDTIGAGDAFVGGLVARLAEATAAGRVLGEWLNDTDDLVTLIGDAAEVSAVVCTRRGADPPSRAELSSRWAP